MWSLKQCQRFQSVGQSTRCLVKLNVAKLKIPITSSIARPLLYILTVHLDFMTVLTYMRGIKITINILMKYLERFL